MEELLEWFQAHGWAGWGLLAVILAAAEMLTLDLSLLMLASGALAASITWFIVPQWFSVQLLVGIIVSLAMLLLLRPTLLRRVRQSPGYRSSLDELVGASGLATAEISKFDGEVRVNGQVWEARAYDPTVRILPGQQVEVLGIDGITLLVYPSGPGELTR